MKVISHRGAASLAPENTLPSFTAALALPIDGVETDIQQTKDGKLVLFHDNTLERTTGAAGTIQDKTWDELQALDAGTWFDPKYAGTRIPLLTDILDRFGTKTSWDLEIKQPHIEDIVVKTVEPYKLFPNITFTSFDFITISDTKRKYPFLTTGFLTDDFSEEMIAKVKAHNIDHFCPKASLINKEIVDKLRSAGFYVRAWGVKNPDIMKQAIEAGVDGMTVDFPQLLLQELGRR